MTTAIGSERRSVGARRWRLSVRGLMVFVLGLGGWLGYQAHLARVQKNAVAAVKAYGGFVTYDWEFDGDTLTSGRTPWAAAWIRKAIGDDYFQRVVGVNLAYQTYYQLRLAYVSEGIDDVMAAIGKFSDLKFLVIQKGQATDRTMDIVGGLKKLESLEMSEPEVTDLGVAKLQGLRNLGNMIIRYSPLGDESLRHLSSLPRLENLMMQHHRVTDKGLYYLRDMTNLKRLLLDFGHPRQITDAGMIHLKNLTKLECLGLQDSNVTDAGLNELTGLVNLKGLWLKGSPISDEAKNRFRSGMPNLPRID